eukprot:CAMPEP_0183323440 /NCGR_PEP_ID=MMETSP0160_2-20130417/74372_1 /TAXON_ID=2839 ORGANISM="Odontella Sinensis, Strain Grunow 1884" /NCGR_SAMPLE_ID=MMETSP0160_2 /ASSEMBLY_ACC=CAM_ASM_000250 /LENGTH=102 /DNA_ID=CAMNT_0025490813 /DNA_START=689 /DNA_END=993 /DNA_ORIENTATION=-
MSPTPGWKVKGWSAVAPSDFRVDHPEGVLLPSSFSMYKVTIDLYLWSRVTGGPDPAVWVSTTTSDAARAEEARKMRDRRRRREESIAGRVVGWFFVLRLVDG